MPNRPCTAPSALANQTDQNLRSTLKSYLNHVYELYDHISSNEKYRHQTCSIEETIKLCNFFSTDGKNHLYQYTSEGFSLAGKIYDLLSIIEKESESKPSFVREGFRMDYRRHALSVLSWCTTTLITPPNAEGTASHFYGEDFNSLLLHFRESSIFHRHFHETCEPKRDMTHEYDWVFGFLRLAMLPPLPEQAYWHIPEVLRKNNRLSSLKELDGSYYDPHAIANFVIREVQTWEDASIVEYFRNNLDNFKTALALIQQNSNDISNCDKPPYISNRIVTMYQQLSSITTDDLPLDDPSNRDDLYEYVSILQDPDRNIPAQPKRTYLQKLNCIAPSAKYYYDTDIEWDSLEQEHKDAARDRPFTMIEKIAMSARKQSTSPHPKSYYEHIRNWQERTPAIEYPDDEKSFVYDMALRLKRAVTLRFPNNQEDTVSAEVLTIDSNSSLYNRDTYFDYYKYLNADIHRAFRASSIASLKNHLEKVPTPKPTTTSTNISELIQSSCAKSIIDIVTPYIPTPSTDDQDSTGSVNSDTTPTHSPQAQPHISSIEIVDRVTEVQENLHDCHDKTDTSFLLLDRLCGLLIHDTPPEKSTAYQSLEHSQLLLETKQGTAGNFTARNLYQELEDCAEDEDLFAQEKLPHLKNIADKLSQTLPSGSAKVLQAKVDIQKKQEYADRLNKKFLKALENLLIFLEERPGDLLEKNEALKLLTDESKRHSTATAIDISKHLALDNGDVFSAQSILDYNAKRPPTEEEKVRPFADGTVLKSIQNPYDRQPITGYVLKQIVTQGYRFGSSPDCDFLLSYCTTADNHSNQARYDQDILEQYGQNIVVEICPTTLHQMCHGDTSMYDSDYLEPQIARNHLLSHSLSIFWDFSAETSNETCHDHPEQLNIENLDNLQAAIAHLRKQNHRSGLPILQNQPDYEMAFLQLEQLFNGLSDRTLFAKHSLHLPQEFTKKLFGYIKKDNPNAAGHRLMNTWIARNLLLIAECIHPDSFEDYSLFVLWAYRSVNEVMSRYKTFDVRADRNTLVAPAYADAVADNAHTHFSSENVRELTTIGKYLSCHTCPESPYALDIETEHKRFQRKLASIYLALYICRAQCCEFIKVLEKEILPVIGPVYSALVRHYDELHEQCSKIKFWYLHCKIYGTLDKHFVIDNYADNEQNRRDITERRAEIEKLKRLCEETEGREPHKQDVKNIVQPKELKFFDRGCMITTLHKLFSDIKVIESVKGLNMIETPEELKHVLNEYEQFKESLHCHMITMPQDSLSPSTP